MLRTLAILGLVAIPVAAYTLPTRAHDAPSGWAYSAYCCSNRDCAEVDDGTVVATGAGYDITIAPGLHPMVTQRTFREVIPYGDKKVLQSPDGKYHVCIISGAVRCLYAPPMGF